MTKSKNIEYENGMLFVNGPPMRSGGYDNWNWCKTCTSIWKKGINRCQTCNQMTRAKPKNRNRNPSNSRTRLEREEARRMVLTDLRDRRYG